MILRVQPYQSGWAEAVEELQRRYIATQPRGARFVPAALYEAHPAYAAGENVLCAQDVDGTLRGYGALFPGRADLGSDAEALNTLWIHIRVDPLVSEPDQVQQELYRAVMDRCRVVAAAWSGRQTRVAISYPDNRQSEINFFADHGFERVDTLVRLWRGMERLPVAPSLPAGLTVQFWKPSSLAERRLYLAAERACFPHTVRSDVELDRYFDLWEGGSAVSAVDAEGRIAGNVMAYWVGPHAVAEDVFVLPAWRRQAVASHLVMRALRYLKTQGQGGAGLQVLESNRPAVALYRQLGYQEVSREEQWATMV